MNILLKEKILKGEKTIGTHINFCDPSVGRIAGLSGYDFIWIDMEHNYISYNLVLELSKCSLLVPSCIITN